MPNNHCLPGKPSSLSGIAWLAVVTSQSVPRVLFRIWTFEMLHFTKNDFKSSTHEVNRGRRVSKKFKHQNLLAALYLHWTSSCTWASTDECRWSESSEFSVRQVSCLPSASAVGLKCRVLTARCWFEIKAVLANVFEFEKLLLFALEVLLLFTSWAE